MDYSILSAAGLSEKQAYCYEILLSHNMLKPAELCKKIGESRTNTYALLDDLVEMGLVEKVDYQKKFHYRAVSPVQLLNLVRIRREAINYQEKEVQQLIPKLLKSYYEQHEQPGVRFFQGKKGIEEMYMEQIRVKKPIWLWRTRADIQFFGFEFMSKVRKLAPKSGIARKAFTVPSPEVPKNHKESDAKGQLTRTWYKPADYSAPVEWAVYGDKVAITSFGNEAIGMIIDSPQIAESVRQLFKLLDEGLKRRPDYKEPQT